VRLPSPYLELTGDSDTEAVSSSSNLSCRGSSHIQYYMGSKYVSLSSRKRGSRITGSDETTRIDAAEHTILPPENQLEFSPHSIVHLYSLPL
jgi:hypothetical protein